LVVFLFGKWDIYRFGVGREINRERQRIGSGWVRRERERDLFLI